MTQKNNRGLEGLDALILFIAIVLVTAVLGIFLITSTGTMIQTSLSKSTAASKGVTSGLEAIGVIGEDASLTGTPHKVSKLHITIRLMPGTNLMPMNTTLIIYQSEGVPEAISFNTTCSETPATCVPASSDRYMISYVDNKSSTHENGYIATGDVARITLMPMKPIEENQEVRIAIVPAHGPRTIIEFYAPNDMLRKSQSLWPVA